MKILPNREQKITDGNNTTELLGTSILKMDAFSFDVIICLVNKNHFNYGKFFISISTQNNFFKDHQNKRQVTKCNILLEAITTKKVMLRRNIAYTLNHPQMIAA